MKAEGRKDVKRVAKDTISSFQSAKKKHGTLFSPRGRDKKEKVLRDRNDRCDNLSKGALPLVRRTKGF